jgi:type IV pilus assembly protein PilB
MNRSRMKLPSLLRRVSPEDAPVSDVRRVPEKPQPAAPGAGPVRPLLGKILVEAGRLTYENLDDALERHRDSGVRVGEALLQLEYVRDEDVAWALATQNEMSFYSLKYPPSPILLHQVPARVARQFGVVPVDQDARGRLILVAKTPLDFTIDAQLRTLLGRQVVIAWGVEAQIDHVLENYSRFSQW